MSALLRHKIAVGLAAVAVAALAGGAYAASQTTSLTPRAAFLADVAKRLGVSEARLRAAVRGAFLDQLSAPGPFLRPGRLFRHERLGPGRLYAPGRFFGPGAIPVRPNRLLARGILFGVLLRGGLDKAVADGVITRAQERRLLRGLLGRFALRPLPFAPPPPGAPATPPA